MNGQQRKQAARKEEKNLSPKFYAIDLATAPFVPDGCTRAFRNNKYTVTVYDNDPTNKGFAIRVMIQNHYNKPIERHWSEIYKIKNELFGEETTAIEYYPAKSNTIDVHNIYWIWIFPDGVLRVPLLPGVVPF